VRIPPSSTNPRACARDPLSGAGTRPARVFGLNLAHPDRDDAAPTLHKAQRAVRSTLTISYVLRAAEPLPAGAVRLGDKGAATMRVKIPVRRENHFECPCRRRRAAFLQPRLTSAAGPRSNSDASIASGPQYES
jgi:hypothetical protein